MTEHPPGNYPPPGGFPPPGNYPPPGGFYPPAPGAALPKEAYAPWITRVVAYLIDTLPAFSLVGIGLIVMVATGKNECVSDSTDTAFNAECTSQPSGLGMTVLWLLISLSVVFGVWNYGYRQGTTGSSIGKSVMKFKVVSEKTGQPIGFGLSVVRQIAHIIDGAICYIGYLFPLWDAKRQPIADKIMSTVCLPI